MDTPHDHCSPQATISRGNVRLSSEHSGTRHIASCHGPQVPHRFQQMADAALSASMPLQAMTRYCRRNRGHDCQSAHHTAHNMMP